MRHPVCKTGNPTDFVGRAYTTRTTFTSAVTIITKSSFSFN